MAAVTCITLHGRNFGSLVCIAVRKHFRYAENTVQTVLSLLTANEQWSLFFYLAATFSGLMWPRDVASFTPNRVRP